MGIVSADDHVQEHPEVWAARLSHARWGERIPHVEKLSDGTERWVVDGQLTPLKTVAIAGAARPDRTHEPQRWEEVPPVVYDPAERVKALDADGVDYSVLYPTVAGPGGEIFARLTDPELELACVQAYNDWLLEEWAGVSHRFIPQCLVPLSSVEATVAEIRRAVARGHRGVIFPAVPMEFRNLPHINEPYYDPIWATCEELAVPLCLHAGASMRIQVPPDERLAPKLADAFRAITRPASQIPVIVNLLMSRILLRHPKLRVVFAESALGWSAYVLEYTDHQFREDGVDREGYELLPSEMFKRQCYLTTWYDRAGTQAHEFVGTSNILWSTNFPMATSSWPDTQAFVARSVKGIPDAARNQILWGNAAALYRLNGDG
ncbi:MAG: amidohydrolase family protein [Chloroflexi bacterium]|nr:amidohydrolase family protein [Chloroflexota bacterium]